MSITEREYVDKLDSILEQYLLEQLRVFDEYGGYYHFRRIILLPQEDLVGEIVSEPRNIIKPAENKTLLNNGLVIRAYQSSFELLKEPVKKMALEFEEPAILYKSNSGIIYCPSGNEKIITIPQENFFKRINWDEIFRKYYIKNHQD